MKIQPNHNWIYSEFVDHSEFVGHQEELPGGSWPSGHLIFIFLDTIPHSIFF
jgi:hypothetical protein